MSLTEAIFARPSYSQMERLIAAEEVKNRIMSTYVGTPLVASTAAGMTDTDRIYVYVGSETGYTSGNWYYYDGSAWTSGGVYNSTAFETDDTLTIPDAAADSKVVGDELSDLKNALTTKAEQDGAYPDLTAGQMLSKVESADSVPYNFRAVPYDATLEYTDAIVGGSVVQNQLVNSGMTSVTVPNGHKYLSIINSVVSIGTSTGTGISINDATKDNIFDLTQMFGTQIADYVNTLETTTEGAGVSWLKKHFPKLFTYQPYNAGEIVSVQGMSQHVTRDADNNILGTYPLDDSLTLRGILKLDSNNQLYADGDRYLPDGTVQRRYALVDLGTLDWIGLTDGAYCGDNLGAKQVIGKTCFCSKYDVIENVTSYNSITSANYVICFTTSPTPYRLYVKDSTLNGMTSEQIATAMSGVQLVYELATSTTEEADPYTVPQIIDTDGTEEYVSTSIVPVGHESRYPLDIAGRLDKILTMPTANGTYTLTATVNNGAVTYAWVSTS